MISEILVKEYKNLSREMTLKNSKTHLIASILCVFINLLNIFLCFQL
jgi:hypothetical protein